MLSPFRGPSPEWDDWEERPHDDFYLVLSKAMAGRIAQLPVTIVWLTTWRDLANSHIGTWFGWEPHEVLDPTGSAPSGRWKLEAVQDFVEASGGPFVWIDDDIDAMAPSPDVVFGNHRHLLVCPDPLVGLTPRELDRVEAFLRSLDD